MRLGLPGPSDVLALAGSLREAVSSALDLVPRVTALVEQAEVLLARVDVAVGSAEATVQSAQLTIASAQAATAAAARIVEATAQTTRAAADAVAGAQGLVNRVDPLLTSYESSLHTLAPVVATLASTTSEREVSAGVNLVDRLPMLIAHVDEDLLPLLARLDQVGPDLHELLEVTQDLHRVVTGLPGVGLLRRRGDTEPPPDPETA